ncbi:hypothetical protein WUBG_11512 [Wuchereria bancrofti]|uniref:Uncharacterized protein n=1 Tax=Wuchereria bancrofti TaxID=6293 RepID=J9AT35_WUCBA|nr:hypothetical protein WUBG_11512 [Wuchereria bancrofti]
MEKFNESMNVTELLQRIINEDVSRNTAKCYLIAYHLRQARSLRYFRNVMITPFELISKKYASDHAISYRKKMHRILKNHILAVEFFEPKYKSTPPHEYHQCQWCLIKFTNK